MACELSLIIDDREVPPDDAESVLGNVRFLHVVRRRMRLIDELRESVGSLTGAHIQIKTVANAQEATDLVRAIENRGAGPLYLRLPSCIMPLRMFRLPALLDKSRYALESMLLSPIFDDEAVTLLTASDAVSLVRAQSPADRRAQLLRLSGNAPTIVDHLGMVDLRKPKSLLQFLSGSTEARHFNSLKTTEGVLQKQSLDIEKMRGEYEFFHLAPERMKRFLLPTFDFREQGGSAGYSMDHLAVPDAAIQFIHSAFTPESYGLFLDQAFSFLKARTPDDSGGSIKEAWERQISEKLRTRMNRLLATPEGQKLDALLTVAGPMGGLKGMAHRAEAILAAATRRDKSRFLVVSHGDLCFSNMLFDQRLGLLRLIDPRGATRLQDAMMHPLYDVAKLSHSALGGYDFINNDLFHCSVNGELCLHLTLDDGSEGACGRADSRIPHGPPDWSRSVFRARLEEQGYDLFCVRAVELSLFLSMLPLHIDHLRKLVGFALTAASLIEELEGAEGR